MAMGTDNSLAAILTKLLFIIPKKRRKIMARAKNDHKRFFGLLNSCSKNNKSKLQKSREHSYRFETLEQRLALSATALSAGLGNDLAPAPVVQAAPLSSGDLVALTVDPTSAVAELGASHVGFTYWYYDVDNFFGDEPAEQNPVFTQLLDNLGDLQGPAPLRIGGGSAQRTWWNPNGISPRPSGTQFVSSPIKHDLTPDLLDVIKTTIDQTGSTVTFGLNAAHGDIGIFEDMADAILTRFDTSDIDAFEIGNEPDRWGIKKYRPSNWDYDDYIAEFQDYHDHFRNNISATAPLSGPAFSMIKPISDDPEWNGNYPNFTNTYGTDLASYTLNRYPTTDFSHNPSNPRFPSIENILADYTSSGNAAAFEPSVIAAINAGSEFRLTEANTASGGGREGVSDTFASALWFLDATMASAAIGVSNTLVPSAINEGGFYSPFKFSESGSGSNLTFTPEVHPLYYGMLFFAETVRDGSTLVEVDQTTSSNVKTWATVDDQGVMRVLVINKDLSDSGDVHITIPGASQNATLIRLEAPDVESKTGVTLAGQTFDGSTSGLPVGSRVETSINLSNNGTYDFDLSETSAAILTIQLWQPSGVNANAGSNSTAFPNNVITLDGLGSTGSSLDYLWEQTSGPETVVLTGADEAVANFTATTVGDYTFQLTVDDGTDTDSDIVNVSVLNVTASAGLDQSNLLTNNLVVTLDGSSSVGSPLTYLWEQLSGPETVALTGSTQVTATFSPDIAGDYTFQLTATNGSSSDTDQVLITIEQPGAGPSAYREVNGQVAFEAEGYQAILVGQNDFSAHTWTQQTDSLATGGNYMAATPDVGEDAGDTADGAALEYNINFTTTGTYYVHVRMRGLISRSDQLHAGLDQPATYGAKAMRANRGHWEWENKIRGLSGNNRVRIDVDTAGVKQFHIWMREDGVQVDKIILTTDVNYAPVNDADFGLPVSPFDSGTQDVLQANAGSDSSAYPNNVITLNGSGSTGSLLDYLWEQTDGPETVTITNATEAIASFSAATAGNYTFQLTVGDGTSTDADTLQVSILDVTANAGTDQGNIVTSSVVTLNGSGSVGLPLTYLWEQLSGPETVTLSGSNQVTSTFTPGTIGDYTFQLTTINGSSSDTDQVSVTIVELSSGPAAYREIDGLVVFDAEGHQTILAGQNDFSAHSWELQTDSLATGGLYMEATPDVGRDAGDTADGAALEYNINFTTTGTYYVHVRMRGLISRSDQLHAGLDQPATYGAKAMRSNSGDWEWEKKVRGLSGNNRVRIDVDTAGVKQFHIWMREDGVQVDKIILTTDVNYAPASDTDFGPPVSPFDFNIPQPLTQNAPQLASEAEEVDSAFEDFDAVSFPAYSSDLAARYADANRTELTERAQKPARERVRSAYRPVLRSHFAAEAPAEQSSSSRRSYRPSRRSHEVAQSTEIIESFFHGLGDEEGLN